MFGSLKDRYVQVCVWTCEGKMCFKNGLNKRDGLSSEVPLCSHIVLCLCGQVIVIVLCLCRQVIVTVFCLCRQVIVTVLHLCGQVVVTVLCLYGQVIVNCSVSVGR